MSSSDANTIVLLINIANGLNRYFSLFIYAFGVIGNLLNILILAQRSYHSNSCALLFLVSAVASLVALISGLTTRMLAGWAADPGTTIAWFCKLRAFIVFTSRTVFPWLIALASIDRWFSSSANANHRQISSIKNTKRGILLILILSSAFYIQTLYCYESFIINYPTQCAGKTAACRVLTDLTYSILSIVIPILLMLVFGYMTIRNVHRKFVQIKPSENTNRLQITIQSKKKK